MSESNREDEATADDDGDGKLTAAEEEERIDPPRADDSQPFENQTERLEEAGEPLLGGETVATPGGPLPALSVVAIVAFVAAFCVGFFAFWTLVGGAFGVFVGIVAGGALGFGALKLLTAR